MNSSEEAARLILDRERRAARIVLAAPAVDVAAVEPIQSLVDTAAKADVDEIEFDFARASFADSSVLRLAMQARDQLAPRSGRVRVMGSPEVLRLFDLTNTADLFELVRAD